MRYSFRNVLRLWNPQHWTLSSPGLIQSQSSRPIRCNKSSVIISNSGSTAVQVLRERTFRRCGLLKCDVKNTNDFVAGIGSVGTTSRCFCAHFLGISRVQTHMLGESGWARDAVPLGRLVSDCSVVLVHTRLGTHPSLRQHDANPSSP